MAIVTEAHSIIPILEAIGESSRAPPVSPARSPPEWEESFGQVFALDPTDAQPEPAFEFDQTVTWRYPSGASAGGFGGARAGLYTVVVKMIVCAAAMRDGLHPTVCWGLSHTVAMGCQLRVGPRPRCACRAFAAA